MSWSKKGTCAEIVQPLTKAKTTTIFFDAISPYGVVNVKVRVPYSGEQQTVASHRKLLELLLEITLTSSQAPWMSWIATRSSRALSDYEQCTSPYIG
jgi:hypothetical protein